MKLFHWKAVSWVFASVAIVALAGCGQPAGDESQVASGSHEGHDHAEDEGQVEVEGHAQGGWWCNAHGVPEEDCSLCSTTAAAKFKEKGDWCDEHNRAESQCFLCDPSRAEKFANLYEAKFGEKPPERSE